MAALNERQDKFSETLEELIRSSELTAGSRKKLADALQISEATVSHYVRGRVRPSYEVLLGMAKYFNVSLDYLVFGERPPNAQSPETPVQLRAQIRRAVIEASDTTGRQAHLTSRVVRALEASIHEKIEEIIADPANLGPAGFLTVAEAIAAEYHATDVAIMTREFQCDVTPDGEPGPYLEVMTDNLKNYKKYRYLLGGTPEEWTERTAALFYWVRKFGVDDQAINECLQFRAIPYELTSSVVISGLNIGSLARLEPVLYERFRDLVSVDNKWAYISVERADASGGVVIEPTYRESTLRMFKDLWDRAQPCSGGSARTISMPPLRHQKSH
jgi:transcriptional regulator with XRE-family HTH domain